MPTFLKPLLPFVLTLQKFFITHKKIFLKVFYLIEAVFIIGMIFASWSILGSGNSSPRFIREIGKHAGELAVLTYVMTLIPGIITRLQFWPKLTLPFATILALFRRHLGILTFYMVLTHMLLIRTLPLLAYFGFGPELFQSSLFELAGTLALFLFLPLWLTSNNWSKKHLGKYWKKIQSLSYLAMFFVLMHVALQLSEWIIPVAVIVTLEVVSWIFAWSRKRTL